MKKILFITAAIISILLTDCNAQKKEPAQAGNTELKADAIIDNSSAPIHINTADFKQRIFNYDVDKTWKYLGTKPCIIDIYADWCPPCRVLSPVMEEVAKEFAGKVLIYKINADKEKELMGYLGITSLPTLIFCPKEGQPQASLGAMPKADVEKLVNSLLIK